MLFRLTSENLPFLLRRLEDAHQRLASKPTEEILRAWANVGNCFLSDLESGEYTKIAAVTGFHESDIRAWLSHLFAAVVDQNRALDWITRELYYPSALDSPHRLGGLITLRKGCERGLVVQGGAIPLTALPVVLALTLARTPAAVRTGRHDSASWPLLVRSIQKASDLLADSVVPVSFSYDDSEFVGRVFNSFPLIVAFGRNESLAKMGKHIVPPHQFIGFGSRFSLAWLSHSSLAPSLLQSVADPHSLLRKLARDVLIFDKQGCYSVQGLLLEAATLSQARLFCEHFLMALAKELTIRRRTLPTSTALTVRAAIARWAQFGIRQVFSHKQEAYPTLVLMNGSRLPPPSEGPTVWVSPVRSVDNAIRLLRPFSNHLSTLVVAAAPRERLNLFQSFSSVGFTRFCDPGCAQFPDIFSPHDGIPLLSALSRAESAEW